MQQLERYFGFRVTLGKSIRAGEYKNQIQSINNALKKAGIEQDGLQVYVCEVRIDVVPSHFDPSPVHLKLGTMEIHLAVNKRNRDEERMYFINDQVDHRLTEGVRAKAEKFDLTFEIGGSYFESKDYFHELVYVVVAGQMKPQDRKLKVKFLARPTSKFGNKLVNLRSANTKLDLDLDPHIQLRFDL